MSYFSHTTLILLILTVLSACGGDNNDPSPGPSSSPSTLTSVSITSGNNQTAVVGTELPIPLITVLLDNLGKPIAGQVVTFKVAAGAGSVFSGTATSDVNGVVKERWTLGTATGIQKLELKALDANGSPVVFATFLASAVAAEPKTITILQDTYVLQQRQSLALNALILDNYGNRVSGVPVNFTASDGSISSSTVNTDVAGQAATMWTIGNTVGSQTLSAAAAGLDVSTIVQVMPAPLGAPAKIEILAGNLQAATQYLIVPIPMQVRVSDAFNTPIPGVTVNFSATKLVAASVNNSNQINRVPASDVTNDQGIASWRGFFNTPGQQTLDATVDQLGTITFSVNVVASTHIYDGHYQCAYDAPFAYGLSFDIADGIYSPQTLFPNGTLDETTGDLVLNSNTCWKCLYYILTGKISPGTPPEMTASGTSVVGEFNLREPFYNWSCIRE